MALRRVGQESFCFGDIGKGNDLDALAALIDWSGPEPRFADAEPPEAGTAFLPVEITKPRGMTVHGNRAEPVTLEIDLSCGHRLRINGPYDGNTLAWLIRGLSS